MLILLPFKMEQQNDSDKTTFKVKFLGEYHDMVIDWNDDKYEYKEQQVFVQLASLTGIPDKYVDKLWLLETRPVNQRTLMDGGRLIRCLSFDNITQLPSDANPINSTFVKDNIHDVCIENGERLHLSFHPFYDFFCMKRIGIIYELGPETEIQEGVCSIRFCQHMNTKTHCNKVKDLVCNDYLNSMISQRVQPIMARAYHHDGHNSAWRETDNVFRDFNVLQFLRSYCDFHYRQSVEHGYSRQDELYLRMRG